MDKYTERQLQEIQNAFNLFADPGSRKIHLNQVGDCLRILGTNPSKTDIKNLTLHIKPNERISFKEFLSIYQAIMTIPSDLTADDLIQGLRPFDKHNSGFISAAKLRHLLTKCGDAMTDEEVDLLLENQVNSEGNVNYKELIRMIMDG